MDRSPKYRVYESKVVHPSDTVRFVQTKMLSMQQGRNRCQHCNLNLCDYECMESDCLLKFVCKACVDSHPAKHTLML